MIEDMGLSDNVDHKAEQGHVVQRLPSSPHHHHQPSSRAQCPCAAAGPWQRFRRSRFSMLLATLFSLSFLLLVNGGGISPRGKSSSGPCDAPLPSLLLQHPPSPHDSLFKAASHKLDAALKTQYKKNKLDALAVAVVTSDGPVFEGFYGRKRANETAKKAPEEVDRDTSFRLASVTKMFTALETLILRDRGVLKLDDDITLYLPNFTYTPSDPSELHTPVTIRQLMSHQAGIPTDFPPGNMSQWPHALDGIGSPPVNGLPFPTVDAVLGAIAQYPLVTPPWTFPSYSNTGYGLLGLVNVAANRKKNGDDGEPGTHAELVQRDVFDKLGMKGSGFVPTEKIRENYAVSSVLFEEADYDFLPAESPAGGQISSMSDLYKAARILLNPKVNDSILSPQTWREWMRPVHVWDGNSDRLSEVGAPWEITKVQDSWGRDRRLFTKNGALAGYHTAFTVVPTAGYAVVTLMTGAYPDAFQMSLLASHQFDHLFDSLLLSEVKSRYVGTWTSSSNDRKSTAVISVDRGSLWVERMVLEGSDVIKLLTGSEERLPMWSTGREDEFRLTLNLGLPPKEYGCINNWVAFDNGYARGSSIVLMHFKDGALEIPSINAVLRR